MNKASYSVLICLTAVVLFGCKANDQSRKTVVEKKGNPIVIIDTTAGKIKAEIWKKEAPITANYFLQYVEKAYYDGLIFHRVINGFMIQGGGFKTGLKRKPPVLPPIPNESRNGLRNDTGTLAMARTSNVHSAQGQFYINVNDNLNLNGSAERFGYAVFGKVVAGMDVVNKIKAVRTKRVGGHQNVPVDDIVIKSIRVEK